MEKRRLGKTGLEVSPLGFGSAEIGYLDVPQSECDKFLIGLVDAGVFVFDTAECYEDAEEKIGKALSKRRNECVLVTKCGHRVEDGEPPDWTPEIVDGSVTRSLKRLRTDHVDVLLLHSCGINELKNEDLISASLSCKERGLVRSVGYSGDNKELDYAVNMGVFDCIEASLSICDQSVLDNIFAKAIQADLGILIKRPLANSCWRDMSNYGAFYKDYTATYASRLRKMGFTPASLGFDGKWIDLALRFTVHTPGVHSALVGGKNLTHFRENVKLLEKGPLPQSVVDGIRIAWKENNDGTWLGET